MNTTQPQLIMQRWHVVQHEVLPELKAQVGPRTPVPEGSHAAEAAATAH
jgi:hypothetical protein